jgi:signal peptidase I
VDSKQLAASLCRIEIACDSATFAELGTTILALGKSLRFRARGYSMHPLVRDGDLLTIEPVDVRSLQRGDLVFFRNPQGEVVVHRMVRRTGQGDSLSFEVKGDGLPAPDGLVPGKEIFGRVTSIERDGVRMDMRQPGMRLLGLGVALLDPVRIRSIPWLKPLILRAPLLSKYLV